MNPARPVPPGALTAPLAQDAEAARAFADAARAPNTLRAYRADWADFLAWCADRRVQPLPATTETVALYIAARARPDAESPPLAVSTLARRLAAISQAHKIAGYESPASRQREPLHSVWRGVVRERGEAPRKVAPTLTPEITAMVEAIPTTPPGDRPADRALARRGKRDRAILLLGFAAALRRSELAAIQVQDAAATPDGLRLWIPRSKTDQRGAGAVLGVAFGRHPATCPVRAFQSWIRAAEDARGRALDGPAFRAVDRWGNVAAKPLASHSIARIVKARAAAAGLDPSLYSGHSLRAGFATQAARNGTPDRTIMRHTRHQSLQTLNEYVREGRLFDGNPSAHLGL
ncbi:MAG: site-specific integrase [Rubricoccaceae bacterium]|nr:site-specific integrase [Rubricoccaceae bacterium]